MKTLREVIEKYQSILAYPVEMDDAVQERVINSSFLFARVIAEATMEAVIPGQDKEANKLFNDIFPEGQSPLWKAGYDEALREMNRRFTEFMGEK